MSDAKKAAFRDATSGLDYFVADDPREVLKATLNSRLTAEPSMEQVREQDTLAAQLRVDAAPEWSAVSSIAESVFNSAAEHFAQVARAYDDMKPVPFANFQTQASKEYASKLLGLTESVRAKIDAVRSRFSRPAIPFPVASADVTALQIRLNILENATPDIAAELILDGVQRGDVPFLTAAVKNLRSWTNHKAVWKAAETSGYANDLIEKAERAIWSPEIAAAEHCAARADAFAASWRYLLTNALSGPVDPMHRQAGALSPMLDPVARVAA
ncbi:MAG: hypothetical protein WEE89_04910 [Gemmatimonadota bacterium]